jgi:hypothetical protein
MLQFDNLFEIVSGVIAIEGTPHVCVVREELLVMDTLAWALYFRKAFENDVRLAMQQGDREGADHSAQVAAEITAWLADTSLAIEIFEPLARRSAVKPITVRRETLRSYLSTLIEISQTRTDIPSVRRHQYLIEYAERQAVFYATEGLGHAGAHTGPAVRHTRVTQTDLEERIARWL